MTVAKHKATFFTSVGMQVNINMQLALQVLLLDSFFHRPNRRLLDWIRILIVTIQILRQSVNTVEATIDAIWIEHWNDFEYELVTQYAPLCTLFICEEFPDASEYKTGGSLARMHPR